MMDADVKLFLQNAHRFWAARERILADPRMRAARVPIICGIGAPPEPELGDYLEWWSTCEAARPEGGLIYHMAGNPMTGSNSCEMVTPTGESRVYHAKSFLSLLSPWMDVLRRRLATPACIAPYTLAEVVQRIGGWVRCRCEV